VIAIIGPGAVGRGLGSCLLAAGEEVLFVARSDERGRGLRRDGLARSGILGERRFAPDRYEVAGSLTALRGRALDAVLVCTKARDASGLAPELAQALAGARGAPSVVLCLNGWGSHELYADHLGAERLYDAVVITGFRCVGGSGVEITVHAEPVRVGSLVGAPLEPVRPLCRALARGDLPCEPSAAIEADLWAKMLYNCALNPLGALIGVPYGELARHDETRAIITAVVAEIFAVLERTGHRTRWSSAAEYLEVFWNELLPATAAHESSMLEDLRAGRRTEVEVLTGAVGALARDHGAQTPVCNALTRLVQAREERLAGMH